MHWKVRSLIRFWQLRFRNPLKALFVELRIIVLAFKSTRSLNLGDIVVYCGSRYILTQGVASPSWDMRAMGSVSTTLRQVHQDNFKKERSWRNFKHDLSFTHHFYASAWRGIWESFSYCDIIHMTIALWSKRRKEERNEGLAAQSTG